MAGPRAALPRDGGAALPADEDTPMDERFFRLDGRAGLVVGAGSGIGRAIALAFGSVGAIVGCVDRSAETAQATMREITAAGGKAEAIACDVTSEAEVGATVARFVSACG